MISTRIGPGPYSAEVLMVPSGWRGSVWLGGSVWGSVWLGWVWRAWRRVSRRCWSFSAWSVAEFVVDLVAVALFGEGDGLTVLGTLQVAQSALT